MKSFVVEPPARPLRGYVTVPGDKSIGHRALMFGALADGVVQIRGLSGGGDNTSTRAAMAALGVRVDEQGGEGALVTVHGVGVDGLRAPSGVIDCGNSGTSMRLLCGLLAGQPFATTLTGDESLIKRPMRRVIDPITTMGGRVSGVPGPRAGDVYPPLAIAACDGRLQAIEYRLPIASAQVKSAVLLAALYADGLTRVIEPGPSRDHTERMLAHMGAPLVVREGGVVELDTRGWDRHLEVARFDVPGDPSSAAFLVAAALVAGAERVSVGDVCINPTRIGFLDALASMNARVELEARRDEGGEPTADIAVSYGAADDLRGAVIEGDVVVRAIDELPILAVVAARATGSTEFRDAAELRVKESDRIATTCAMLRAFGVEVDERPDGFTVHGVGDRPFSPATIDAAGDHRIAMSAAVAALRASGPVRIDDVANVATSFPTFAATLMELGAVVRDPGE
ncbi:MAG TPA: 3-phosphoshikimate 1-carboxyvinyltransferase [Kofleriaceae bacterium]|nr:3-phosphoshikimate 1-carboxyvinyltransferase [Kofleriaceae bacterium]